MRYVFFASLLLAAALAGCDQPAPPTAQPPTAADVPLAAQLGRVRNNQSTEVRLTTTRATAADLPGILAEKKIVRLILNDTDFTDDDLKQIAALPALETLRLSAPRITDAALANLAQSKTLRHLILLDAPVTDAGLAHLATLATLESLYLTNTRVTDSGLESLLRQRPGLHVH